jgi:hypothetical protein
MMIDGYEMLEEKVNSEYRPDPIQVGVIRAQVQDAMAWNLTCFSFENIIDTIEDLSPTEKQWAKEYLDWEIVVREQP